MTSTQWRGLLPTTLSVDSFLQPQLPTIYFLSHFHSDHYQSLSSSWTHGKILCTKITKRLIVHKLGVAAKYLHVMELNTPLTLKYTLSEGTYDTCSVTAIDANHCPGAVMLMFVGSFGSVVHTGDFRYHPNMLVSLSKLQQIDRIYLDNTFLDKTCGAHELLLEEEAIDRIEFIVNKHKTNTVVLVAIDQVGKEILLCLLALRFKTRIYLPPPRWETLPMLDLTPEQMACFTNDLASTRFRVCSRNQMTIRNVQQQNIQFPDHQTIGIRPSGFALTDSSSSSSSSSLSSSSSSSSSSVVPSFAEQQIYRVKYSSHSSRNELLTFLRALKPKRLTATSVTTPSSIQELHQAMLSINGGKNYLQVPKLEQPQHLNLIPIINKQKKRIHVPRTMKERKKPKLGIMLPK